MEHRKKQVEIVYNHLKNIGTITSMEAIKLYGITRLSDKIFILRKKGVNITTNMKKIDTMYGKEKIAVYKLEK